MLRLWPTACSVLLHATLRSPSSRLSFSVDIRLAASSLNSLPPAKQALGRRMQIFLFCNSSSFSSLARLLLLLSVFLQITIYNKPLSVPPHFKFLFSSFSNLNNLLLSALFFLFSFGIYIYFVCRTSDRYG